MYRSAVVALACLFAVAGEARAASPNPDDLAPTPEIQVKSRALVRQLGSEQYSERERAQEELVTLGRLAKPALLAGVNTSPDPEVRRRCSELLPKATTLDIKAKLDTFLADTNGEYEHDLPGWKTFRTIVGAEWTFLGRTVWSDRAVERAAREVFAELVAAPNNRQLLLAVDGSRVVLADLVTARRQELYSRRYPRREEETAREPALDEVVALLFADSRVGSQYLPRRGSISSLLNGSGFTAAARGKDAKARVYRALAAAWLESRNEPREMAQVIAIAVDLDLPDQACRLAARLITVPGPNMMRSRAVSALLDNGTRKHIPLLEGAFATTTVVASVPNAPTSDAEPTAYDIQLRDIALCVSILLANQKLADYDLIDRYAERGPGYDGRLYAANRYYFRDDEARKRAFAKWTEWRKAHANE
jgi:hypothetical protein